MRSPLDAAQGLLQKAENDLFAADTVIATARALDTVCFHAQQAVEKSLKALLALRDVRYPLTHDVEWLLALTQAHFPDMGRYADALEAFHQHAVPVRYDQTIQPEMAEAQELLHLAHMVFSSAAEKIAADGGGGQE